MSSYQDGADDMYGGSSASALANNNTNGGVSGLGGADFGAGAFVEFGNKVQQIADALELKIQEAGLGYAPTPAMIPTDPDWDTLDINNPNKVPNFVSPEEQQQQQLNQLKDDIGAAKSSADAAQKAASDAQLTANKATIIAKSALSKASSINKNDPSAYDESVERHEQWHQTMG